MAIKFKIVILMFQENLIFVFQQWLSLENRCAFLMDQYKNYEFLMNSFSAKIYYYYLL